MSTTTTTNPDYATQILKVLSYHLQLGYTTKTKLVKDKGLVGVAMHCVLGNQPSTKVYIGLVRNKETGHDYSVMVRQQSYKLPVDMQKEAEAMYIEIAQLWVDMQNDIREIIKLEYQNL